MEGITDPIVAALRRQNSSDPNRLPRSRARFCIDQCTAVTVACILLLAVSVYLLTQSELLVTRLGQLMDRLLENVTIKARSE